MSGTPNKWPVFKKRIAVSGAIAAMFVIFSCGVNNQPAAPSLKATPTSTATCTPTVALTEMVYVPGGIFYQDNNFIHTVTSFMIGKYEVTYELWYSVRQWALANGYQFQNAGAEGNNGSVGAAPTAAKHEPVTKVSFRDTIVWCNACSQMKGLTPVYYTDLGMTAPLKNSTSGTYGSSINSTPGSFDNPYVNWQTNGFRLPTEGEWQYAASYIDGFVCIDDNSPSGSMYMYTNSAETGLVAWYEDNSGNTSHDVGLKNPNFLGIYDMSGNVEEQCWDWYDPVYPSIDTDYRGPASGAKRVCKGGGYWFEAYTTAVGSRSGYTNPYYTDGVWGFRVARTQ